MKGCVERCEGDHLVSRDANFACIENVVCKKSDFYARYIYICMCVCVCTEAILFVLGWGEGRFCTSHITEADGTADL